MARSYTRAVPPVLYTADVVCPMSGPPLQAGGVLVNNGVIVAVSDRASLVRDAAREHHVEGVLLPGLVNGHTHLELTDAAQLAQPGPYPAWLTAVDGLTATWSDERWSRSAHRGVLAAVRAGSTLVCDVVTQGAAVPAASRAGLRGTSYVEVAGVDATTVDVVAEQVEATLTLPAEGRAVGIGLHSPPRLGTGVIRRLAATARASATPLTIHAGASSAEAAALRGDGPLAAAARARGFAYEWLDHPVTASIISYLDALGALTSRTSVLHGVWIEPADARRLAARSSTVVLCPRASARLSDGDIPLERYADAGVSLALGTESLAAVDDLDVLAEAAAWAALAHDRGVSLWPTPAGLVAPAEAAIRLATVDGARALGWGGVAGRLEPGARADLVGIHLDTTADTVYRDLVERGAGRQVLTVLAGVRKARRADADQPWAELDDDSWRRTAAERIA